MRLYLFYLCFILSFFSFVLYANGNPDSLFIYEKQYYEKIDQQQYQEAYELSTKLYDNYWKHPDTMLLWANYRYDLALKMNNPKLEAKSLYEISTSTFHKGKYETSIAPALKADSILQIHPNDTIRCEVLYRLAEGYEYTGSPEMGMQKYSECYALAEKAGLKKRLIFLDTKLGNIHRVNDENQKALEYFNKAVSRIDKQENMFWYLSAVAKVLNLKILYPNLLSHEDEIVEVCDSVFAFYNMVISDKRLERLESFYFKLFVNCISLNDDKVKLKTVHFPSLAQLQNKYSNKNHLIGFLVGYFDLALLGKDYPLAEEYLEGLYQLSDNEDGDLSMKINALIKDNQLKKSQEDYKGLTSVMKELHQLELKVREKDRLNSVSNLEGVLEAKEKEHEITLLNKDMEILSGQSQQRFFATISFALISLLGFGFFWNARRKNKIIANQNQQLEQLNQTKDRIFAIIGHDLRKPAIAFRGITKKVNYLLKKEDYKTLNALGEEIERDALALNELTDNLLNWALMQRDVLPHHPQEIAVEPIFKEINTLFSGKAKDKNIDLTYRVADDLSIYADANGFQTVVRNLVDNALKYTPSGGQIILEAIEADKEVKVKVSDNGVGMSAQKIQEIFVLKKEKSEDGTAGEKGTGLGMYLVNELVKLNKGTIEVISQINKGTTFEVMLPKRA